MHNHVLSQTVTVPLTINKKKYDVNIEYFGEGKIPLVIAGHSPVYSKLMKKNPELLKKFRIYNLDTYWTENSPLADPDLNLSAEDISKGGLETFVRHIEEIRQGLVAQGLLESSNGKIGIYGHSGFSAVAISYAAMNSENALFILAEGPPPYFTEEWNDEKELFYVGNFKRESNNRANVLEKAKFDPRKSAVSAENMENFYTYKNAYQEKTAGYFYQFQNDSGELKDYREIIWGENKLNMPMMKAFFGSLSAYDCRQYIDKVTCPVDLILGVYDTAVPPYLWPDSREKGGIGFFSSKERDYHLSTEAGHWPLLIEQPEECCKHIIQFVETQVEPLMMDTNRPSMSCSS